MGSLGHGAANALCLCRLCSASLSRARDRKCILTFATHEQQPSHSLCVCARVVYATRRLSLSMVDACKYAECDHNYTLTRGNVAMRKGNAQLDTTSVVYCLSILHAHTHTIGTVTIDTLL